MRVLILMTALFGLVLFAQASETTITYQGQLQDGSGPYDGEPVDMRFRLYDSHTGGSAVTSWVERSEVQVTNGMFKKELDFGEVYDQPVWLAVEIDGQLLSPRQRITAAPLAVRALSASPSVWTRDGDSIEYFANSQGMSLVPNPDPDGGPGITLGHSANVATNDGATVSGGGSASDPNQALAISATVGGGRGNTSSAPGATIAGGFQNEASLLSTIAGGGNNSANGNGAFIGGGLNNTATGSQAVIPGGSLNQAAGRFSFAAGYRAHAEHDGAFVWADSTEADFQSTGENQFLVRAEGGAVISGGSNAATDPGDAQLYVDGTTRVRHLEFDMLSPSAGDALCVSSDSRVVVCGSSGRLKDDIEPLQNAAELVEQLRPVRYRWKANGQHDVGLIAEEVAQVLPEIVRYSQSGEAETLQYSRVAALLVGAFQELELAHGERLASVEAESARLHDRVAQLTEENRQLQQLADRNTELEARLAALESLLLEDRSIAAGR